MRELALRPLWLAASIALVAFCSYMLLAPGTGAALGGTDVLWHAIGFFLLSLWFFGVVRRRYYGRIIAALLAFAAATEYLQSAMSRGRVGDPVDFLADAAGIGVALLVALAGGDRWCEFAESLLPR